MSYKFLKSSPTFGKTQQEVYKGLFQETLNNQFTNTSDIWTIEEEVSFGSETYQDVDVRVVTHVISSATGKPLGDDWKQILFQDLEHSVGLGFLYQFSDNYWIAINPERIKNLAASIYVKRCNNTLRWIDDDGAYHSEPCSIDYEILRNVNNESPSSLVVLPSGRIIVICQFNERTNLIRPNQRFLFGNSGNWTAYKVSGGGVNNYQNTETLDNTTVGFIRLTMEVNYVSDNDDLTNGIAYEEKMEYALSLSPTTLSGIPTKTAQLYYTVTLNGSTVDRDVIWSSSDVKKATVNSTGLVTMVANGTATITCSLDGDSTVKSTCSVTVSATPSDIYQVIITPDTNYILEGETENYTVYLWKNGTIQADTFSFSVTTNTVPTDHFAFSYSVSPGNLFSIKNEEMFLTDHLTITCTSGTHVGSLDIYLRGSW
jgi:hypothetical protein